MGKTVCSYFLMWRLSFMLPCEHTACPSTVFGALQQAQESYCNMVTSLVEDHDVYVQLSLDFTFLDVSPVLESVIEIYLVQGSCECT